jgi:hypothetical protein
VLIVGDACHGFHAKRAHYFTSLLVKILADTQAWRSEAERDTAGRRRITDTPLIQVRMCGACMNEPVQHLLHNPRAILL